VAIIRDRLAPAYVPTTNALDLITEDDMTDDDTDNDGGQTP
jgi:hypothetical protein